MQQHEFTPAREYAKGQGEAVADRTVNRKVFKPVPAYTVMQTLPRRDDISLDHQIDEWCKSNGYKIKGYHVHAGDDHEVRVELGVTHLQERETWADVADRVSEGNALLLAGTAGLREMEGEREAMRHHLRQASILMSGRHLQHGDFSQPGRNLEIYTNCSTSATSFLLFYLLLNGSGVGRDYSDHMIQADLSYMPIVVPVIDMSHKDVQSGEIVAMTRRDAEHLYAGRKIVHFEVPDSREGWAKVLEKIEYMAFLGTERETVFVPDFSKVRSRNSPIAGMQGRPASGPGPLMQAIVNIARLRDAGMAPWRAAMYADHYAAECVLVGGARRAARMATKYWKDETVIDFVNIKRGGFLWSSNNSVLVDAEFWELVQADEAPEGKLFSWQHARAVFKALTEASYFDQTGEPGLINVDRLTWNAEGIEELMDGNFAESDKYKLEAETLELTKSLVQAWAAGDYQVITNPCGEIVLASIGGYCVIADVVPFHAGTHARLPGDPVAKGVSQVAWDVDAEDAFRVATRALIRTNLMDSLYKKEVRRTNRIGVGMTGFHEYAWARFGYGWKDLINEDKSKDFWLTVARFKRAVQDEARTYSEKLGVVVPHTNTTFKPAGCASLDTAIKTTEGVLTMRELFAKHDVTESDLRDMEDGTWIEPTVKTLVLDEGNVEREVTKLYLNGVKPVYEIEFEDGVIVKLTGNHKLKTVTGEWRRVDELTEKDDIAQF